MNDFTEEELKIIFSWGKLYYSGVGLAWPKICTRKNYVNILKKVKQIINSNSCNEKQVKCLKKCKHEWQKYSIGTDENGMWDFNFFRTLLQERFATFGID
jgi:hypothetical protein